MNKTFNRILSVTAGALMASALTVLMPAAAMAEEGNKADALVVTYNSGAEEYFFLQDTPVVTFSGQQLHIKAVEMEADREMADVAGFTFEKRTVGSSVETVANRVAFCFNGTDVTLSGLEPAAVWTIYDLNGVSRKTGIADASGACSITLSDLGKGLFILSVNNTKTSYKLNLK